LILLLSLLLGQLGEHVFAQPPASKPPTNEVISNFLKQLSNEDEKVNRAAAERLASMPDAIPALKKAAASNDRNVWMSAEPVLREALLRKNRSMAKGYPVDLFVERLLRIDDAFEEESYWRVAAEFAGAILDEEKRGFNLFSPLVGSGMPVYDYLNYREFWRHYLGRLGPYPAVVQPTQEIPDGQCNLVIRRASIGPSRRLRPRWALLTSPGPIRLSEAADSVILGGNVVSVKAGRCLFIVADGDVSIDNAGHCFIITRGSFKSGTENGSVVLAGGKAEYDGGLLRKGIVRAGIPKLLGWVRFFEISDAGVEVTAVDGGVKVTKVVDKQPPQKAGLQSGDIITAIDGTASKDVEQFRQLLRRGTVQESTKFTVRRDGKSLELSASFVGWEPPPVKP
jgi:hypothetical protein